MDITKCYEYSISRVAAAARSDPRKRRRRLIRSGLRKRITHLIGRGPRKLLRRLIRIGRAVHLADNRGWRAIHEAAAAGRVDCLKDILSEAAMTEPGHKQFLPTCAAGSSSGFKAYVNSTTHEGETACYLAAEHGHLPTLRLLVKAGADINQQTNEHLCPLYAAVTDGNKDMVQVLLAKGALVDRLHSRTWLYEAVYVNNVDIVRMLVTRANLEACDDKKITPLILAAQHGHRECVEVLVQAGADVNAQDRDLATPLSLASRRGHLACVEFLLEHGADPNLICKEAWPELAMHGAAQFGHLEILKRLVPVSACSSDHLPGNVSPLYYAIESQNEDCVDYLLSEGFNPDAQDCSEILGVYSPLHLVLLEEDSYAMAPKLLMAGAALRITEWGFLLAETDLVELVLDLRWLYPPSFPGNKADEIKSVLRPEEFQDMCATALARPDLAQEWLPPLIRAGLDPYLMLHTDILMEAKGSIVNFLLQFVNWSTLTSSSKAILCHRRAEGTWQPFPQFDSIPNLLHLCRLKLRSIMGPDLVLNSDVVQKLHVPTELHSSLQFKDIQVDNTEFS
ncbi:ankyrin repeat and SOCS box protein 3-like isoform X2 [Corythoichthys intestinalis]|uniref:ankyrin repeat and SOCS box protein 3-like isoform X2 n=1 Tax=Corythoichthys intestinalis TaxID=161448 RepID=UPI0025A52983|nr:ankyrin repeat and SOCS box protein 3-like isoform X2 [Corythoichthys intestinalis]